MAVTALVEVNDLVWPRALRALVAVRLRSIARIMWWEMVAVRCGKE